MNYITVKLTEDQAGEVLLGLMALQDNIQEKMRTDKGRKHRMAFNRRIVSLVFKALIEAKAKS